MSEAAGNVKIIFAADASSYSAALSAMQRQLDQFAAKAGVAGRAGAAAGHGMVAPWQASSAALRVAEGNMTNNIRAAERFLATIPGVGKALQVAFPVVGAIALLGVFSQMGKEVADFVKKVEEAPKALESGFRELTSGQQLANDELRKTNDELSNQIAKLEGKQPNNLAIAIDDARIAADKLAQSLDRDNAKTQELLKRNQVGWMGALLGKDPTSSMAGAVNYWQGELADRGNAYNDAVHQFGADDPRTKAAMAALDQRRKDAEAAMQAEIDYRKPGPDRAANVTGDQTANLNIARGYLTMLQMQDDQEALDNKHTQLDSQEKADQKKNDQRTKAAAAARKFAEQQRQQQEQIIQGMRDELTAEKATRDMTLADEANFWLARAAELHDGSKAYQTALLEANKAIAGQHTEHGRLMEQWNKLTAEPVKADDLSRDSDVTKGIQEQSKAITEWLKNLNEAPMIQKQNAHALAEQSLQMAVATGQMSKLDAAQVRAQMHAEEYADQVSRLQEAMAAAKAAGYLTTAEKNAQLSGLQNQMDTLAGQRNLQVQQDQAAIDSATALDQVREACGQLAQRFMDLGAQLANLTTETIQGFNQSFASAVMEKANSGQDYRRGITNALGGQFRQLGSRSINMALENVEGPLLSKLGLGSLKKPDGTAANPLYVKIAGGGIAAGPGGLLSSGGLGPAPAMPNLGTGMSMSGMTDILSSLPGFAGGGDTPSNMPFLVGEDGPEIFNPGVTGSITPNNKLSLGGSPHMSFSVDARGSNDPAQTEAAVYRGLNAALPHFTTAAMSAMADDRRRSPLSKAR